MKKRFVSVLAVILAALCSTCCGSPVGPTTDLHVTPAIVEGTVNIPVLFTARGGNGTYVWRLLTGVGDPTTGRGTIFVFTPRQKGIFTISVTSGELPPVVVNGGAK